MLISIYITKRMVVLYKDVENLIMEFAGIYPDKHDGLRYPQFVKYECDCCHLKFLRCRMIWRDLSFVKKMTSIGDNGNDITTIIKKSRFWRLHLCDECKDCKTVKSSKGVSIKSGDMYDD